MGPALVQRIDAGLDHVGGSVEIGLADFEVDDALALALERARFIQNFEGSFGAEARHAAGKIVIRAAWFVAMIEPALLRKPNGTLYAEGLAHRLVLTGPLLV